jgi:glutaminyl-peptide cyclotransferase
MNNKLKILFAAITLLAFSCHHNQENITISPEAGTAYKAGDEIKVSLGLPSGTKIDSVIYLVDSVRLALKKDSSAFSFKTDSMPLGIKLVTAKIYTGGTSQEVSTNIVLKAAKAPEELTFSVEKVYPHDTSSYTEGFEYHDGFFYESSGGYLKPPVGEIADQQSTLRKVDPATGRVVQMIKLDPAVFGEGITMIGNRIIQLTYREKIGYAYNKDTFGLLSTFSNTFDKEGWGLCNDGSRIYNSDGTNRVWFLDKNTCRVSGYIDVYDDKGEIDSVNELEYINGKLYANVYQRDTILVINPKTGALLQRIDMKNLWPNAQRPKDFDGLNNVLNGIAWDEKGKRLFVTGKKWPHVYQVKFVPKAK